MASASMALSVAQDTTATAFDSAHLEDSATLGKSHELFTNEMEEIDYESLPTDRLSTHLMAGAAAGMMEHCSMYPVDCVKVRVPCVYVVYEVIS